MKIHFCTISFSFLIQAFLCLKLSVFEEQLPEIAKGDNYDYKYMNYDEIIAKIDGFQEKYPNYITKFDAATEFEYIPQLKCGKEE